MNLLGAYKLPEVISHLGKEGLRRQRQLVLFTGYSNVRIKLLKDGGNLLSLLISSDVCLCV